MSAEQALLGRLADVESVHELRQSLAADALAAGELLEQRVRVGDRRPAGRDLGADDASGWPRPSTSQLASRSAASSVAVEGDLAEPALDVVEREQRVAEADADVALGGRVGEVALQAAGDERGGERVEHALELSSRLASAFSNRIGLTLCGIVDEPVAPGSGIWRK